MQPPLSDLLILCPSYGSLEPQTEMCLREYRDAGARTIRSVGVSDIALHRCVIAGMAETILLTRNQSADVARLRWVLWFDADMCAEVSALVDLRSQAILAADALQRMQAREQWPAVSGRYVQRSRPNMLTAQAVENEPPIVLSSEPRRELPAVYAGMGAMLQTAEAFLTHCAEAEHIDWGGRSVPMITAAGPARRASGEPTWNSEDFAWCSWEWHYGRGVYLSTVPFGHVMRSVVRPSEGAALSG